MRHHSRIRSLQSAHNQKQNQHKYKLATNNAKVNNVIADTKEDKIRKRNNNNATIKEQNYDRKKSARVTIRNVSKLQRENEDRSVMPTNREITTEARRNAHDL